MTVEGITLQGLFNKATTTIDGGWNVTFSCNQSEVQQISLLSELRDQMLQIAVIPTPDRFLFGGVDG